MKRTHPCVSGLLLAAVAVACAGNRARSAEAPVSNATFVSDETPIVRCENDELVLRKRLAAYKTFGGYDVAYTGQTARWTFSVPETTVKSARLVLSMSADDHATFVDDYAYILRAGTRVLTTPTPLRHGTPASSPFDNWLAVGVPAEVVPGETLAVSLTNTSSGAAAPLDWIAVRWIELRLDVEDCAAFVGSADRAPLDVPAHDRLIE